MVRPAKKKFIDGSLPLKVIAQIFLLLQIFVSFSYVLIFVILETKIWFVLMLIFLAEMSWAILTLAGVQAIERTAAVWRLIIFAVTDATLLVFWAL
jgi:hypothetical protein